MPTFSQLPSGQWRVQVGRALGRKGKTFLTKREARIWVAAAESQASNTTVPGFLPVPKSATLGDLIDKYTASAKRTTVGPKVRRCPCSSESWVA